MNYHKQKAKVMRDRLDPARARIQDIKEIEVIQDRAAAIKDQLISCNMRLVVSIAKRHAGQVDNFFDLLSYGNISLRRVVENVDYSRVNSHSTYPSCDTSTTYTHIVPK